MITFDVLLFFMNSEKQEQSLYIRIHSCSETKRNITKKTKKLEIIAGNFNFKISLLILRNFFLHFCLCSTETIQTNQTLRHYYADPRHISSHPLFDERQGLLPKSYFGCYWFTGDSVPTSFFDRRPNSSWRFLKWIGWDILSDILFVVYVPQLMKLKHLTFLKFYFCSQTTH